MSQAQPWRSWRGGPPGAWRSFGLAARGVCVVCLVKASWGLPLHTLPSPGRTWLDPASVGCSEGFLGLLPLPEFLAAAGGVSTWFLLGGGAVTAEFWLSSARSARGARRLAGGIMRG